MPRSMQFVLLAGVAFVLVFGGLSLQIYNRYDANKKLEKELGGKRAQIDALKSKVRTRDDKEQLLDDIEKVFNEVVEILPLYSPQQDDNIYNALEAYRALHELEFVEIVPIGEKIEGAGAAPPAPGGRNQPRRPAPAKKSEFGTQFQRVELAIRYKGTFLNFLRFLSEVERHPSFLRVDEIVLNPSDSGENPALNITLKVSTFHYVVNP